MRNLSVPSQKIDQFSKKPDADLMDTISELQSIPSEEENEDESEELEESSINDVLSQEYPGMAIDMEPGV